MIQATGIICIVTYLLLFVKLLTRLLKLRKADRLVMRMHEAVSGVFFLSMLAHVVMNLLRFQPGRLWLYLSGAAAALTATALITLCHLMRDPKLRYKVHLLMAIAALIFIVCHNVCAFTL